MKIVYCLNSIRYIGGIQKVTVVKANALAEVPGNEVYIVVTDNKDGVYTEPISEKVHLIDLDVNYYQDDWKSKWHVLKGIFIKRKEHKERLKKVLNEIQPDVVISVGQSEKNMVLSLKGEWARIREFHYNKNYRLDHAKNVFAKVLAFLGNLYDYQYAIKKYDRVILLTEEDKNTNWKNVHNVSVIPNPSTFKSDKISLLNQKKVVSVGRLALPKNYSSLVRAFRKVVNKYPDWILEIYGDGPQRNELEKLISDLQLGEHVFLKGYSSNVGASISESSIFVLSSIFEGFALVIVEAMTCGVPVVSYACPCGPKDIIDDGVDGFLVSVNDEQSLADRICQLIKNEELRKKMGTAALEKAKKYEVDNIVNQWMDLFRELTLKK